MQGVLTHELGLACHTRAERETAACAAFRRCPVQPLQRPSPTHRLRLLYSVLLPQLVRSALPRHSPELLVLR